MCGKSFCFASFVFVLSLTAGVALAGIDYGDPDGGWTYIYTGDAGASGADFTALDGTWSHDNGSDSWDESEIGSGLPGGVNALSEEGVAFVRLQDTGDPRDHGGSDPSNRKIFFGHQLIDEIDQSVADEILSVHGITISFRARLSTTPPLDDLRPDGGGAVTPLPAGGDGYVPHDGGKACFGVHQEAGGDQTISFALSLASDDDEISVNGLTMNKLNGTSPSGDVDLQGTESGTVNIMEITDPTVWHEFWIIIQIDTSGGGTHKASIYMDGSSTATEFHVTSGTGGDFTESYISLGVGATPQSGAIDVDFFAYKEGIITPAPSDPDKARAITPAPGSTVTLADATPLGWKAGESAARHDVYFGTSEVDVNDADTTDTSGIYQGRQNLVIYTPAEALELGGTYYWRIDEVEADGVTIHKGDLWSFTILDHIVVDDFEDYDSGDNQIWYAWHDGLGYGEPGVPPYFPGNGTGASVGDETTSSFTEETIAHGGRQSLPYWYNNNKQGFMKYSESTKTLTDARDWTEQGVKALSLWFRGFPAFLGGFTEAPAGTFTMTAEGADIAGNSDQFHFAWQELTGAGSIVAKVESVQDTDPWAKAGVMIRDTLDADAVNAMVAVTPGNGIWFGRRTTAGGATDSDSQADLTVPYWVKLERTIGGLVRASYSTDGSTWTQLGASIPINMNMPMYIGLAVTSHNPGVVCEAIFSNVTSNGVAPWTNQDIGLTSNEAAPMYLEIANNNGTAGIVHHDNPDATLINSWTEWNIDLKDFSDQGVDLTDVNSISIGFGDKTNPQAGGSGKMFIDDISLYRPRYVPDKVVPLAADFTDDGIVNFNDLEIMMDDWLNGDYTISAETPGPVSASWEFENNVNGSSGDNGIAYGGPTYGPGKSGQAINFDGVNDYVVVTDSPAIEFATGSFSIALWVKSNYAAGSDKQFIICNGTNGSEFDAGGNGPDGRSSGKRYVIKLEGSDFRFTLDDDATKTVVNGSSVNFATGDWIHAVVIRDDEAKELRIYCNGELENTNANPATADISSSGEPLYIGAKQQEDAHAANSASAPIDHYFEGMLDDLRIYNYALSHNEVLSIAGLGDLYVPLTSPANISDDEPANSMSVNFKDFAVLADEWLQQLIWPAW
ncbi:LamG-like jellyroll fold domain-containing protein [Planctomycetota bacterium]